MRRLTSVSLLALGMICTANAGAFADAKVDEQVVGPANQQTNYLYTISPRGLHLASVAMKGSRYVVIIDGAEGPKFDEIYTAAPKFQDLPDLNGELTQHSIAGAFPVAFSPDGRRYAYAAREDKDVVVIADGKEIFRAPFSYSQQRVNLLMFSPDGKHVYFQTPTTDTMYSSCLVMDGQPGPACAEFVWPVFSPDGAHWAHYAKRPKEGNPAFLVIDGKEADYVAGRLRYTPDGKHLVGVHRTPDGKASLLVDGKPLLSADQIDRLAISPIGDIAAVATAGQTRKLYINGKAIAGTESAYSVVFSPDGKRWGVRCAGGSPVQGWQVIDGKKGQQYSSVNDVVFTADSSKAIYVADVQGNKFVVVDGEESEPNRALWVQPFVSPGGAHYAYVGGEASHLARKLVVDGRALPPGKDFDSITFSPDGSRYGVLTGLDFSGRVLMLDGKQQPGTVGQNTPILFSPDSKHFAVIATPPNGRAGSILIDDIFLPLPPGADQVKLLAFTPDSQHLVWRCQQQKDGKGVTSIYVDGASVAQLDGMNIGGLGQNLWEMGSDGVLTVMGTWDRTAVKRLTITPSAQTNVVAWAADVKAAEEKAIADAAQQAADKKAAAEKAAADAKAAQEKAVADRKAAQEKATADRKAALEKAAADKKAAYEKAMADRKAAQEKAAAERAAKKAGQTNKP